MGIVVESVGERTGKVVSDAFLSALDVLRGQTGIPIVLVETASSYYRSGRGAFHSTALRSFVPDVLAWWTGGQHGFLHVSAKLFVPNALTFVSTWDGDELSMIQAHHQLRAARSIEVAALGNALEAALRPLGFPVHGAGLYRVIDAGDHAVEFESRLERATIRVKHYAGGRLAIAPPLDRAQDAIDRLRPLSA